MQISPQQEQRLDYDEAKEFALDEVAVCTVHGRALWGRLDTRYVEPPMLHVCIDCLVGTTLVVPSAGSASYNIPIPMWRGLQGAVYR